jgi:hypothetical protein
MADLLSTTVTGTLNVSSGATVTGNLIGSSNIIATDAFHTSANARLKTTYGIEEASFRAGLSILNGQLSGVFANTDGTRVYVVDQNSALAAGLVDVVHQLELSTPWEISTATLTQTLNVASQEATPIDVFFRPEGNVMYLLGNSGDDITTYDLSTPWNVATATVSTSNNYSLGTGNWEGFFFKPDGTMFFAVTRTGAANVYQYTMSSPWNVATATTNVLQNVITTSQETTPYSISLTPDGKLLYVLGESADKIIEYTLPTAWNIVGATPTGKRLSATDTSVSVPYEEIIPAGMYFAYPNNRLYIVGSVADDVAEFDLYGGMTVESRKLHVNGAASFANTVKFYREIVVEDDLRVTGVSRFGSTGQTTIQSSGGIISTSITVTGSSSTESLTVSGRANVTGNLIASSNIIVSDALYTSDNTKIETTGGMLEWVHNRDGNIYPLPAGNGTPSGIFANTSGTRLYVSDQTPELVYQIELSEAWNLATATTTTSYNISAQETAVVDLAFRVPEGNVMYVLGDTGNDITWYDLSTPWDVTTATFTTNSNTVSGAIQTTSPSGMYFKPDGTKLWVCSTSIIWQFTMSTPWDLTAASLTYDSISLTPGVDTSLQSLSFSPDGKYMYLVGITNDYIYEFFLPTAWNISGAVFTENRKRIRDVKAVYSSEGSVTGIYVAYPNNRMYLVGTQTDDIIEYLINGVTVDAKQFSVTGKGSFKDDVFVWGDVIVTEGVVSNELQVGSTQQFTVTSSGTVTTSGSVTVSGSTATLSAPFISASQAYRTSGNARIEIGGGVGDTEANIAFGATEATATKNVRIGTDGTAGSKTNIIIGPTDGNANVEFYANTVNISGNLIVAGVDIVPNLGGGGGGAQGAQGVQGAQGFQGAVGAQGFQGIQGAVGAQGSQGIQGAAGAQGFQGIQGAAGAQGFQGIQGAVGAQGSQGIQGAAGAQGFQGIQGAVGAQGFQGIQGSAGGVGLRTIWVPAQTMLPRTTAGAGSTTTESTTNNVMVKTYDFDTTTQEFVQFSIRMPKSWDEGTITYQAAWTAASGSGGVTWSLAGVSLSDDDPIDTAFGTAVNVQDTFIAADDIHVSPISGAVTIAGTPTPEDITFFQVSRVTGDGNDTLGVDARLIGITLFVTTDAQDDT